MNTLDFSSKESLRYSLERVLNAMPPVMDTRSMASVIGNGKKKGWLYRQFYSTETARILFSKKYNARDYVEKVAQTADEREFIMEMVSDRG